jgi:hypothetical protein
MSVRERIVIFFWYIAILCWAALICASIALVPALGGRGWVEAWGVIVVLIFLANFFALAVRYRVKNRATRLMVVLSSLSLFGVVALYVVPIIIDLFTCAACWKRAGLS